MKPCETQIKIVNLIKTSLLNATESSDFFLVKKDKWALRIKRLWEVYNKMQAPAEKKHTVSSYYKERIDI